MNELSNLMRLQAELALNNITTTRLGFVSSYDFSSYSAKVLLQPDGTETGYLPIFTSWVGNNWGLFCPPNLNDMVAVVFQEGNIECGIIMLRGFQPKNNQGNYLPLQVNPGEFWLVHSSGSSLKFTNDGDVSIVANNNLNIILNDPSMNAVNITGSLNITGSIIASGDISDGKDSMEDIRTTFNSHTHAGGAIPDQQMPT